MIRKFGLVALVWAGCSSQADLGGTEVGVEPGGQRLFIADREANSVLVYDLATLERVAELPVAEGPSEVHADRAGERVWVVSRGGNQITIVRVATLAIEHTVDVGVRPVHSFLAPDGVHVWVGNDGSGEVSIVNLETGDESRVLTGNGHHKMALATDDAGALSFAYVSNIGDGTITVVDPGGQVVKQIDVGPAPHGMDYSFVTQHVYNCSGDDANSIEVIATRGEAAHSIVSRIPLPARCGYIHVDESGHFAHATLRDTDELARIDLQNESVTRYPAGDYPDKVAVEGTLAFVSNVLEPSVTVVDLEGGAPAVRVGVGSATVTDGRGHRGLRKFEDRLFVPNSQDGTVSVIDLSTREVVATLQDILSPAGIAVAGPEGATPYPR